MKSSRSIRLIQRSNRTVDMTLRRLEGCICNAGIIELREHADKLRRAYAQLTDEGNIGLLHSHEDKIYTIIDALISSRYLKDADNEWAAGLILALHEYSDRIISECKHISAMRGAE